MIKAPINLQDLRRSLYVKAKAEPAWRFWGLYIHVCKMETLHEAYRMAKSNNGAPGIDGVTFEAIEESGEESFLRQIRDELVTHTYRPMRARRKEIPKDGGKVRVLSIPASLAIFRKRVRALWWHSLRRRSQQRHLSWTRMMALGERWLPQPCVLHPYPAVRFAARHPR